MAQITVGTGWWKLHDKATGAEVPVGATVRDSQRREAKIVLLRPPGPGAEPSGVATLEYPDRHLAGVFPSVIGCEFRERMQTLTVQTAFADPPIPVRSHDWQAWLDGQEDGGAVGNGATEDAAVADLLAQVEGEAGGA